MYSEQGKLYGLEQMWAEWVAGRRPLTPEEATAIYHDADGQLVISYNTGLEGFLEHVERLQPD